MFTHQIATAIDAAGSLASLDALSQAVWKGFAAGACTDAEAQTIAEAVEARRNAFRAPRRRQLDLSRPPTLFSRAKAQRPPERQQALERRRRLATSGPMPPELACMFTMGELAVLRVVGVVVLAFGLLNVSSGLNLLGVSGLGGGSAAAGARTASGNVTVAEGIQTVRMTQNPRGYEPADTVLYAGLPTRWVIEGTSPFDCSAFVRVPGLDLSVDLAMGPNTVELPPLDEGEVPFTCVMGMYSGTLTAIDQPEGGP